MGSFKCVRCSCSLTDAEMKEFNAKVFAAKSVKFGMTHQILNLTVCVCVCVCVCVRELEAQGDCLESLTVCLEALDICSSDVTLHFNALELAKQLNFIE